MTRQTKILLIFLFLGVLAYFNALRGPFMLDDYAYFDEKIKKLDIGFQLSLNGPTGDGMEGARVPMWYRPMANILLMGEYFLFGEQTYFYHIFGLFLWVLAAYRLYRFLWMLFPANEQIALWAALLYLVHPINGLVVNYITASVYALQVILIIEVLARIYNTSKQPRSMVYGLWSLVCCPWSLVFFLLALMCHETSILVPLYATLLLVIMKKPLKVVLPFWGIAIAYFFFRIFYASLTQYTVDRFGLFQMNIIEYVATLSKLFLWYLWQLVSAEGIVILQTFAVVREQVLIWVALGAFFVIALVALAIQQYKLWKSPKADDASSQGANASIILLGVTIFISGFLILPAAALLQPLNGMMIEPHWFVFSSWGIMLLVVTFLFSSTMSERVKKTVMMVVIVCCCLGGWRINYLFANEKRYGQFWFEHSPTFLTLPFHLARIYERDQQTQQAQFFYEYSFKHHWRLERVAPALGWIYLRKGEWEKAKRCLMIAVRLNPKSAQMWTNLGVVLYKEGDYAKAKDCYLKALSVDPSFAPPRLNLNKLKKDGKI